MPKKVKAKRKVKRNLKESQKSLKRWSDQKWTTASGKKSSETGEVYAPKKTIE